MIIQGDCIEVMAGMPENSVDAVVTDPPYGLSFMGKEWDKFKPTEIEKSYKLVHKIDYKDGVPIQRTKAEWVTRDSGARTVGSYDLSLNGNRGFQDWCQQWATQALRVLKPGGYLLAFGGTRTSHRLVCGLEDAGFEIRDTICWLFGSGFPKNLDISKQIDKMAGAEREVIGQKVRGDVQQAKTTGSTYAVAEANRNNEAIFGYGVENITAPATEAAKEWQGWGTALKPAFEPICVARKPLSEKNVASNVLRWGTGGIDIDGSRIGLNGGTARSHQADFPAEGIKGQVHATRGWRTGHQQLEINKGRWPANVILDEEAAAMLDEQSGERSAGAFPGKANVPSGKGYEGGWGPANNPERIDMDKGGASRFFYCAKASSKERGKGNNHPTCKPLKLMEYLIKLVSREGATILDPFAGSGSTILAAEALGRKCIGIEQSGEYCEIASNRCRQICLV